MIRDSYEARLVAAEIAIDALLAEVEELRRRLHDHVALCPLDSQEIRLP